MPKYIKKSKPSWANLKYFKPWSSIREKIRDKFTRKKFRRNTGNENINSNTSSLQNISNFYVSNSSLHNSDMTLRHSNLAQSSFSVDN